MNKIGLVLVAAIALGMLALPATLAYYSGQHSFIAGADVECTKCHTSVADEYVNASDPHIVAGVDCNGCHVSRAMNPGSLNPATRPGGHASTAVECMDCHSGTAGGSSKKADSNGNHDITVSGAAHYEFYLSALNAGNNNGANEACIGCHTHAPVNITFTEADGILTYTQAPPGTNGTFS